MVEFITPWIKNDGKNDSTLWTPRQEFGDIVNLTELSLIFFSVAISVIPFYLQTQNFS